MKKKILAVALVGALALGLAGCYSENDEVTARKDSQSQVLKDSLGRKNQEERLKREEDPNQIRYVYVFAPLDGRVIGYYTIVGKVSTSGTQNAPEQDLIQPWNGLKEMYVVDSAKDDGTYGPSETGSFFFTTEGVLIEIDGLPYLQSDSPIQVYVDAPSLNK